MACEINYPVTHVGLDGPAVSTGLLADHLVCVLGNLRIWIVAIAQLWRYSAPNPPALNAKGGCDLIRGWARRLPAGARNDCRRVCPS